jgi:hypothetical protein
MTLIIILNTQSNLFNLGVFTHAYESPNIIQIALKRLVERMSLRMNVRQFTYIKFTLNRR